MIIILEAFGSIFLFNKKYKTAYSPGPERLRDFCWKCSAKIKNKHFGLSRGNNFLKQIGVIFNNI
jgi:hypothetical protein